RRLLTTGCVQSVPPCGRVKNWGRRPRLRCGRRGGRLRGCLWFSSLLHTPGKVHEPPRPPCLDEGPMRCLEVLLTKTDTHPPAGLVHGQVHYPATKVALPLGKRARVSALDCPGDDFVRDACGLPRRNQLLVLGPETV